MSNITWAGSRHFFFPSTSLERTPKFNVRKRPSRWATSAWGSTTAAWPSSTIARPCICSSSSKMRRASCSAPYWRGWPSPSSPWRVRSPAIYESCYLGRAGFNSTPPAARFFVSPAAQNSSTAKQKSLTAALEIMAETRCAFQMIHKELLEEQTEVV